jgi:putative Mg2+ transporter-C (MgtC) family protein
MPINIYVEEAVQVSLAFVIGAAIGLEREFRSKPAGFRTMILICVGSCLYTILSKESNLLSPDRISSNIVTGIGFIGAGVIFKEGISVNGLTTAALIWVTAALGMAIGYGNYPMAALVSIIVIIALFILEPFQRVINKFRLVKDYRITTNSSVNNFKINFEDYLKTNGIGHRCMKLVKENNDGVYIYRIASPDRSYDAVNTFLLNNKDVKTFEY